MNLHHIVRGAINAINPDITVGLQRSNGYTVDTDGSQIPAYITSSGLGQVQALGPADLKHVANANIQSVDRKVYLYGNWMGVVRADQRGGDILSFPQVPGAPVQQWKVVTVFETWPDWCAVGVVLQNAD